MRRVSNNIGNTNTHHNMSNMASLHTSFDADFTNADHDETTNSPKSESPIEPYSSIPPRFASFDPSTSTHRYTPPTQASHNSTSQESHTHSPPSPPDRSNNRRFSSLLAVQDRTATENVASFVNKHSPHTLNPEAGVGALSDVMSSKPMFCNRHKPELKCWRQANEPTMEELQCKLSKMDSTDQQGISHLWSLFSSAPNKQRELMLQGILAVCCFPQLSFISAQVRELIKIDFISALPVEISFKVLSYLDTVSLCKATQVSRRWNELAEDDVVWHKMCEQHIAKKCKKCGWGLPLLDHHRLQAEKKTIERRALGLTSEPQDHAHQDESDDAFNSAPDNRKRAAEGTLIQEQKRRCVAMASRPITIRPWKDVYRDRFKVGTNWKYGRYSLKVLKGHENGVMCLQIQNQGKILASGSYDGTIKIWNLETGTIIRTLLGHTSGIRCLQFHGAQLFSGGMDRTIRIWNWETGECVRTLSGPMGDVLGLHYISQYLACGGKDNVVRIWNFKTSQTMTLRGHKDFVNSVRVDPSSETVFSSADDNQIRLWDMRNGKVLKTFEGHAGGVQQITILPAQFELDESDLLDCEHPLSDNEQDRDEESHESTEAHAPNPTTTNECGATSFPSVRACRSPAPESLPNTFIYPATSENEGRPQPPSYIMTASLDNTLRLWHVPSGRCLRTFFGHVEGVWAIAADNLRVASGSQDRTVKIWDARTGKCERTYSGHVGPVTCIGLSGDRLVTGSEDCEIRVMEFGPP